MAEKYPRDRFDDIPDGLQRVGAHRAPPPKGRRWIAVGWAALAVVVLVGAGIFGLTLVSGSISFHGTPNSSSGTPTPTSTPTPTPTIVPTVDSSLSVNVLNGTTTANLATDVGNKLTAASWKIGAVANADKQDLTQTIVYYSDPKNQAAALGVAQSLPGAVIEESQAFADTGADLTVVIGSDYSG
ncbi:LytR C-terminal domain-containing protein [Leifsonia sp. McL0607]|uniref:LytR C-terminal domain-containing protein n=1 Tax=Leifsonia sp. McL0607 TaxID=3415672 RepID=UPI003CF4B7C9